MTTMLRCLIVYGRLYTYTTTITTTTTTTTTTPAH